MNATSTRTPLFPMVTCPHCGDENPPRYAYCLTCGERMALEVLTPLPDPPAPVAGTTLFRIDEDGHVRGEFPLSAGRHVIGRGALLNTIEDPWLEEEHALIDITPDGCRIYDLKGPHGTFVGVRDSAVLRSEDRFRIGGALFAIELSRADVEARLPLEAAAATGIEMPAWGRLVRLGPDDVVLEATRLVAYEVTIGRTVGDIRLPDDPFVSSPHAVLSPDGDQAVLRDVSSHGGCYVRIREPVVLRDGDRMVMGHQVFLMRQAREP